MLHDWGVIAAAFAYIGLLFGVASYGDRLSPTQRGRASGLIYPLSLAIYCTSWTFFGSVGFATRTGVDFLAIYLGPVLMVGLATPLILRIVRLAKAQNITSIADFIAARYGKHQAVAATVASIAFTAPALTTSRISSSEKPHSALTRSSLAAGGSGSVARNSSTHSRLGAIGTRSGSGK